MAYAYFLPLLMQMLQSQGGDSSQGGGSGSQVPFGQNYFNPQGGSGAYSSQQGLMGGSMGGGSSGGGGSNWMSMLGGSGGGGGGGGLMSSLGSQTPGGRMGGIANGLFNMFFAKNPSDAADPYLGSIEGSMGKYLNPYIDAGKSAMGTLNAENNKLVNDPGAVMNKIGAGFQQSPGYQFQTQQAEGAANRASAAGGMLGSPMQQQNIAGTINNLANQDYYNYLNHGIGMYDTGLTGMSHMSDQGFNASGMMSQGLLQQLLAQAQNAYAGANTYNQQMGGGISSLIGGMF